MEDERFVYRKESIAVYRPGECSTDHADRRRPSESKKLTGTDPFCGVGTMLIERKYFRSADPLYGVDIFMRKDSESKTILGDENANLIILPETSFFTFEHDYLFDELITDMPASAQMKHSIDILKAETL